MGRLRGFATGSTPLEKVPFFRMGDKKRQIVWEDFKALSKLSNGVYELWELIEAVGSKALGICFDSSHANCLGLDIPEAIRECGDRLWVTHISDNDGTADQHRMPFCGNIDWIGVIGALKEVGYAGLFNLEIGGERCRPLEVQDAKLHYLKEVLEPMLKY